MPARSVSATNEWKGPKSAMLESHARRCPSADHENLERSEYGVSGVLTRTPGDGVGPAKLGTPFGLRAVARQS